jgi:CheY-like chemotaxis protein
MVQGDFLIPPTIEAAPTRAEGRRVLVVDDNVDAAQSLAMILNLSGHETLCAYEPETALASLETFRPHLILLDIGLPRMNGYEVARRIRAGSQPVRLVAITGYGRTEDIARVQAAGFDAHLLKPLDFDELARTLERLR